MTRVALVTGSSGGIGSATVRRLLADDYRVIGLDLLPDVVAAQGYQHHQGDARDLDVVRAGVQDALERHGGLDAVVCAAATIDGGAPIWETDLAQARRQWEDDAATVWQAARAAIPVMLAGEDPSGCRFVAVASAAGDRGLFHLGSYVAAKHAVVGIVRALAADLVGTGITACAVSPGSTRTPMLQQTATIYGLGDAEQFAPHQLLHRLLRPEEIAATIAFCCSVEAAVLNGGVISADGGFV